MRGRPLLKKYSVGANGKELAVIETSEDGRQIFISRINPLHSIFLEGIGPDEAVEIVQNVFDSPEHPGDDWEKLGQFFPIFLSALDTSRGGLPGLSSPLTIERQHSALPTWGKAVSY